MDFPQVRRLFARQHHDRCLAAGGVDPDGGLCSWFDSIDVNHPLFTGDSRVWGIDRNSIRIFESELRGNSRPGEKYISVRIGQLGKELRNVIPPISRLIGQMPYIPLGMFSG